MRLIYSANLNFGGLILLILQFFTGVRCQTGYTAYKGGQVQIKCTYTSEYKSGYDCNADPKCESQNQDLSADDKTPRDIFVTITELNWKTERTYWCEQAANSVYMKRIQLNVKSGLSVDLDKTLSIQCQELCKKHNSDCPDKEKGPNKPKTGDNNFTVTISYLRKEDSGIYMCGALVGEDEPILSVDIDIDQDVQNTEKPSTTKPSVLSGTTILIICSAPLALLLFGVMLFLFLRLREKKNDHNSTDKVQQGDNKEPTDTAADYEEVKDFKNHNKVSTIYTTAKLPKSPDSPTDQADHHDYDVVTPKPNPISSGHQAAPGEICPYDNITYSHNKF